MTITDDTAALDLGGMTDTELLALYQGGGTAAARALAEAERRDQAGRMTIARRALETIRAEGDREAYAQYRAADDWCCGELLSKAGEEAGITDEQVLWRMPWEDARRFASEELNLYWLHVAPRRTSAGYVRQRAAQSRTARAEAREITTEGGRDEQHAGHAVVAGHDTGEVRRGSETAADGTVRGGQPGPVHGPVQRHGRVEEEAGDMGVIRAVVRTAQVIEREAAQRQHDARRAGNGTVAVPGSTRAAARRDEPQIPGDQLLDLLRDGWFGHYARFPSPAALDAVTLWAAHTHMRDEKGVLVFRATPRLCLLSREPGSGKGLALELLMDVVPNCYGLDLEPTQAGLVHTINKERATVLLDEADVMFGAGSRKEGVRAVLNGGTYKYGTILNGKGGKTNRVPVFGPVALAGLDVMETATGDKLNALMTRFVKIRMEKVTGDAKPPKRTPQAFEAAGKAKMWLELWASQVRDQVAAAAPEFPEGMEGRAEDIWGPLLSVADAAGGTWPDRARAACRELALAMPDGEDTEGEFAAFAESFGAL
jgi:hypothetical protein